MTIGRPIIDIPPERTRVGTESEVKIPVLTATWAAVAADIVGFGAFLIRVFWLLGTEEWRATGAWIAETWYKWAIALVAPWIVAFALLAITFAIQTIDKHAPSTRKARDANAGILSAWFPGLPEFLRLLFSRSTDSDYHRTFGGDEDE